MQIKVEDYKVDKDKKKDTLLEEVCYTSEIENKQIKEVPSKIIFGAKGQEREEDNPECYCKMLIYKYSSPSFYIKTDIYGNFIDPWGLSASSGASITYQRKSGKAAYKYLRVSDFVFHTYLLFLETRNNLHYRKAQREYGNA